MRALFSPAVLALCLSACAAYAPTSPYELACTSDAECGAGLLCFPDGCGDPGTGLAVEVIPDAKAGQHAQDFALPELSPVQDFELASGALISGDVTQRSATGALVPYSQQLSVRVVGESLVIPGLVRRFEALVTPGDGRFSVPVATGQYSVLVTPADPRLPPHVLRGLVVNAGAQSALEVPLPAFTALVPVQGQLVSVGTSLLDAEMEVQALTQGTLEPLSQPLTVPPLSPIFVLSVSPRALQDQEFLIRATPRTTSESPVPSKLFAVPTGALGPLTLELGDFGGAVRTSGRVLSRAGTPVAGAVVSARGEVSGGGTFQSASVTTGPDGHFELPTLASSYSGSTALWVVPPASSGSGVLKAEVTVSALQPVLGDLVVPDKVLVQGVIELPSGERAGGVPVTAVPLAPLSGLALPAFGATSTTDADGRLLLALDPGHYRLDYSPPGGLPRMSQLVAVPAVPATSGAPATFQMDPTRLRKGITVRGSVRYTSGAGAGAAAFATVRVYRLTSGGASHLLLGETVTDATGNYSVVLPTR